MPIPMWVCVVDMVASVRLADQIELWCLVRRLKIGF